CDHRPLIPLQWRIGRFVILSAAKNPRSRRRGRGFFAALRMTNEGLAPADGADQEHAVLGLERRVQGPRLLLIDEDLDVLAELVLLIDDAETEAGEAAVEVGEEGVEGGALGLDLGGLGGIGAELGRDRDFHPSSVSAAPAVMSDTWRARRRQRQS